MDSWLERFARVSFERSSDTAHDLKTPLNVAILNLELMRMRLGKLLPGDEKTTEYTRAIEAELRRLAHIFDAFFTYSTPPAHGHAPEAVPIGVLVREVSRRQNLAMKEENSSAMVTFYEPRLRDLIRFFFEGAVKLVEPDTLTCTAEVQGGHYSVTVEGNVAQQAFELGKIFKFYYTDASGEADLSLATARLIAETCGGAVTAAENNGKLILQLSLPSGDP